MGTPQQNRQIEHDYDNANVQVDFYRNSIHDIATTKSMAFTTAQIAFLNFLTLKDPQDSLTRYSAIIILAASFVLPEIGVGVAIAKCALKAKQFAEDLEKVEQIKENAELVKKGIEAVGAWREKKELKKSLKEDSEVPEQNEKGENTLDTSLKLVKEEYEILTALTALIKKTQTTLTDYKYYYLDHTDKYKPNALKNMIDATLGGVNIDLGPHGVEQIVSSYIYALLQAYCKVFVKRKKVITLGALSSVDYEVEGLNDSQQDWILTKMGPQAWRGKYFYIPPIFDVKTALVAWGSGEIEDYKMGIPRYRR